MLQKTFSHVSDGADSHFLLVFLLLWCIFFHLHMLHSSTFSLAWGIWEEGEQPPPLSTACSPVSSQFYKAPHLSILLKNKLKKADRHMLQNTHQDFPMAWLHCQLPKSLETKLNTLLSTVSTDQSAFSSSDKRCPLSLMISPVHLGEESNKIFCQENRGKHHSPSSECSPWPCHQPVAFHLTGQWGQRNAEGPTSPLIRAPEVIYWTHSDVPYAAALTAPKKSELYLESLQHFLFQTLPTGWWFLPPMTHWLWVRLGWLWLCSVFGAHHLLSHSHRHLGPRQYQIGSSSVENYEQIKEDYSCEMNQTAVPTFSISFGIKHLLRFIFILFWAGSAGGSDEALRLPALPGSQGHWPSGAITY